MRLGLQTAPVLFLLLACDGKTVDWCGNPCVLDDAHNFTYQSELQIRQYTRQSGQDLTFDWSDLSQGLQQNLIDPTQDIDELVLVVFSVRCCFVVLLLCCFVALLLCCVVALLRCCFGVCVVWVVGVVFTAVAVGVVVGVAVSVVGAVAVVVASS